MSIDDTIQHNQYLISIYTKNLQALEIRQAKEGASVSTATINEMANYRNMIAELQTKITNMTTTNTTGSYYRLDPVTSSLQKYENFITRFSEEMKSWNGETGRFQSSVLHSLSRASKAKYTFVTRFINDQWGVISDSVEACREIEELISKNAMMKDLLSRAISRSESSIGVLSTNSELCLFVPFGKPSERQIMVIYDAKLEGNIDSALFDIISIILSITEELSSPKKSEEIEFEIYNGLKIKYGYMPNAMMDRQFYLFNHRLENTTMYFEPIVFLSPYAPSIFGWEALARDKTTKKAPVDLFRTAELWGTKFLVQLDVHFLQMATELYVIDYSDAEKKTLDAER